MSALDQMRRLSTTFNASSWNPDGSCRGAFHTFDSPAQFETSVGTHLRRLVERHIQEIGPVASVRFDDAM